MKSSPHRPSIELLFKRGLGSAEIARRLQISSSTVRNVVAAIKKRGDASEVKKSGRPRSVNTRNTRAIIKKRIIRNDGLSLNRMASQLGIARSTVQSIVKNDLKLKSYKLRRGQYLSDKSKAMRLEKCRKLLQHFQEASEVLRSLDAFKFRLRRFEFFDGTLLVVHLSFNKTGHRPMARDRHWPSWRRIFPGFLDKNLWPASSPDLNPRDFSVWGMLEGKIAGKVFATVDDLKAALEVAWASIDDGYLRRTVNSVKKRLRACVKARGSNFEILL
uniref:HTH luxR-type domain-containing protein n=1 Tax=Caenorhabditis japonica TaxID=281687 RepID=A0A8R1EIH2_CAEJA